MAKKSKVFSDNKALKVLSDATKGTLEINRAKVYSTDPKVHYSRNNPKHKLTFHYGCDLLQYNIVVRPFIMKKYRLEHYLELDVLLYLFPIEYFTRADFKYLPTTKHHYSIQKLIDLNHIEMCVKGKNSKDVFRLSMRAVNIVREYYAYLSGEKVLNENSYLNPFKAKKQTEQNMLREKIMLKLKKQVERNPERFKKYTF